MTELEKTIIDALLAGPGEDLAILRAQAARAGVRERRHTGVGFYTDFEVPPESRRMPSMVGIQLTDVHAEVEGVEHGMAFVLFIKNGAIDFLEGTTYVGALPEAPRLLRWSYLVPKNGSPGSLVESPTRNVEGVVRSLAG